jgi:hypothetical protein
MLMFARAFSHNGEIQRVSRCRGIDMLYGGYSVVYEVEVAHRRRYGVKRQKSALDVVAEQVLGYKTGSGGENRFRVCPSDTRLLISNVCALQPHQLRFCGVYLSHGCHGHDM